MRPIVFIASAVLLTLCLPLGVRADITGLLAGTPTPATVFGIPAGNAIQATIGPFTMQDGVTPLTPDSLVYEVVKPASAVKKEQIVLHPVTIVPLSSTVSITLPPSIWASVPTPPSGYTITFKLWVKWTWASAACAPDPVCVGLRDFDLVVRSAPSF